MKALNAAERSSSIVTFVAVYVLITAIPLYLAYMLGKNSKGGTGTGDTAQSQQELTDELVRLQSYIGIMEQRDSNQVNGQGSLALWEKWVADAERENKQFNGAIDQLESKNFKGYKKDIRNAVSIYLRRLYIERGARIGLEKHQRGIKSEVSEIHRLKMEVEQLKTANNGLQNTINVKDQLIASAQKTAGGGGGGGAQGKEPEWDLLFLFRDACSQKAQADILSTCNQMQKRRDLYSSARRNFQKITSEPVGYPLKREAREKLKQIDQLMARL
jgi:hypothetical protein